MPSRKVTEDRRKQQGGPALLEWISGLVGAVLAIGVLAFITAEALDKSSARPPLLSAEVEAATRAGQLYIVEVKVTNESGKTAAAVELEGSLGSGGQPVQTSGATIAYVPGHSERSAGLVFTRDPRSHELTIRVKGYEEP